jgi:glycosyltransferase involved in cell wall biosynthesis
MPEKYDLLILTNIPSFYKVKLYNELAKSKKISVIFFANEMDNRTEDFYNEQISFPYHIIKEKNMVIKSFTILRLIKTSYYLRLIINGWDSLYYWLLAFLSSKKKNAVVVESSYFESTVTGIKGLIKKIFLSRFTVAFVPGENNKKLLELLSFKGNIIKTYGVGIYNRVIPPVFEERPNIRNFVYVGRLAPEKNLFFLIQIFNKLPNLVLSIIGYGPLEQALKNMANENIRFIGEVKNKDLPKYYRDNDVLVLPSLSETWSLVVEEALNNGIPVIISDKVGCGGEIVIDGWNGLIFKNTEESITEAISNIT